MILFCFFQIIYFSIFTKLFFVFLITNKVKRNLNYFFEKHSILVLILLIILAGLFSMYKFFSAENLFFFTGLADDSCALTMVDIMSEARMTETNFDSNYSFSAGMGDGVFQHIPADPINFINYWIKKLIITIGGESSLSVGYFYLKFLFSFLGAGIFTFLWLRTLNVSKLSSLIGGLLLAILNIILKYVNNMENKTCKLWDLRNTSKSLKTFIGHNDEIMDVTFNCRSYWYSSCAL